jgi:hypothetical protein
MDQATYKTFAGLHTAIIAQLQREKLRAKAKKLEQEARAEAAAAKAAAERTAAAEAALAQERKARLAADGELEAVAAAAETEGPLPPQVTAPRLKRLVGAIAGLRGERDTAITQTATAERRARALVGAMKSALRWLNRRAPEMAQNVKALLQKTLGREDAAEILGEDTSTSVTPDWRKPPTAGTGTANAPPGGDRSGRGASPPYPDQPPGSGNAGPRTGGRGDNDAR